MKLSIYATANRPAMWKLWHERVSLNKIDLEIWFCGNVKPDFPLPPNLHFVYSTFKPAQCQAIAAAKCTGDLMMSGNDDYEYTPGLFDLAAAEFIINSNPYLCVLPKMTSDGYGRDKDFTHFHWRLIDNDLESPILPQLAIFKRSFFEKIGGYSKIFVGSAQDQDLSMRMYRTPGYQIEFMPNSAAIEYCQGIGSGSLYERTGPQERMLLSELWIDQGERPHGQGGKARLEAAGPHQPYDLATIQTQEQGPSVEFVKQQKYDSPEWRKLAWKIVQGEVAF